MPSSNEMNLTRSALVAKPRPSQLCMTSTPIELRSPRASVVVPVSRGDL